MNISGGITGLVITALAIALGVSWLVFPWIVYSKLSELIEVQRRADEMQKKMLPP